MFIDDRGNEFKTEKEIKKFAKKEFYEDNSVLIESTELYFTTSELIKWVLENNKEKFIKDFKNAFKDAENDYVNDYSIIHDIKEI